MAGIAGLPQIPVDADGLPIAAPEVQPVAPYVPEGPMPPIDWGAPVDPLAGAPPPLPPADPQGYQFDATGRPWTWHEPGTPDPATSGQVVEEQDPAAVAALQHKPTAPAAPAATPGKPGKVPAAAPAPPQDPYLATMDQAAEQRADAARKRAEAEKEQIDYVAGETIRANEAAAARLAKADAARAESSRAAQAQTQQLAKEATEIANTKMDDRRVFKNMNFGGQLAIVIGAALAGASRAGIESGRNSMLEIVQGMVDRDLQSQAQDLASRREGLATKRGLLADEVAAGREAWDIEYKASMTGLEMAKGSLTAYAQRFNNPVIDARVQDELAALTERQAQLSLEYGQATEARLYKQAMDKEQLKLQQRAQGLNERQFAYQKEQDKLDRETPKAPSVRDQVALSREQREIESGKVHLAKKKDGTPVYHPDPKVADAINQDIATVTTTVQKLDRLAAIYEKNGWSPLGQWGSSGEDQKAANGIFEELLADFSLMKEQGVIRDGEYKRYERMFGSPGGFLDPRTNLKTARNNAVQGMNNKLQARVGKDVATWEPAPTPDGDPRFKEGGEPAKQPAPVGLPPAGQSSITPAQPERLSAEDQARVDALDDDEYP